MRSGNWRGQAVAIALAFIFGPVLNARADGLFHHIIPRETLAMDYRTGDVMMAPPIPGGHYTKDCPGSIKNAAGKIIGRFRWRGGHHSDLGRGQHAASRSGATAVESVFLMAEASQWATVVV